MDRQERIEDEAAILRKLLLSHSRELRCCLPGIIEKVDMKKMTCVVQPSIQMVHYDKTGARKFVDLPLLVDMPIVYAQGGDFIFTFPVRKNDECLAIFADRCIDAWWQNGGVQGQIEFRSHDLSDGFALVGVRSQPRVLNPPPDAENVQLRTEDGKNSITMTPDGEVIINATKGVKIQAPKVDIGGCNGKGDTEFKLCGTRESNQDCSAGGVSLMNHVHVCGNCGTTDKPVQ